MLIGIDGNEANQTKRVGVGEYGYQLLRHLKYQISNIKYQNFKFIIYLKKKPLSDLPKEDNKWKYQVVKPRFLWTQIWLPIALFHGKPRPSVFFTPTHYAPRFCSCPRVISIMDLSFLYYSQMFRKGDLFKLKNWTAYSVKKAKKILTISKSTRNDIIKYYKVEPEKVVVTYPGVSNIKNHMANLNFKNLKRKYKIDGDYILYVGTLQPRKNLVRLIEAFKNIKNQISKIKNTNQKLNIENLKLVMVGGKGWLYEEIFQKVNYLGLEKEVIFTGYVPEEDLPALYKGAKCFVLPSLYEGFGLPALEAMAYGVPVVVSNVSSLPEVVGDAGILVNPWRIKDIARGISEALALTPAERKSLIERGRLQAKKFSWEKCAKETLKVLEEIGGEK